jgi:hypothetical protein
MAKTLKEFKKEFEHIKKELPAVVDEIQSNDNNLAQSRDMLNDNFEQLGPRIQELREAGTQGTKIEHFMGDKEIAIMIKELANRREDGKATALKNQAVIDKEMKPLMKRVEKLQADLTQEIKTRKAKKSSEKLGLNQSWKEMEPLLVEVDKFTKSNPDYKWAHDYLGTFSPAQFDRLYTMMLDKELAKSNAVVLNSFQQMMQTQMLNLKNLQRKFMQARAAFAAVGAAAKDGKEAHAARNIQGLSTAKRDGAAALSTLTEIVEPYQKALSDAKIKDMVAHSQDKDKIEQGVESMTNMLKKAKELEEELSGRTFA